MFSCSLVFEQAAAKLKQRKHLKKKRLKNKLLGRNLNQTGELAARCCTCRTRLGDSPHLISARRSSQSHSARHQLRQLSCQPSIQPTIMNPFRSCHTMQRIEPVAAEGIPNCSESMCMSSPCLIATRWIRSSRFTPITSSLRAAIFSSVFRDKNVDFVFSSCSNVAQAHSTPEARGWQLSQSRLRHALHDLLQLPLFLCEPDLKKSPL